MASGRILHSGNLVRGFYVGDRKLFMDFTGEQYLVRQDDIREAFAVLEGTIEIVEER